MKKSGASGFGASGFGASGFGTNGLGASQFVASGKFTHTKTLPRGERRRVCTLD